MTMEKIRQIIRNLEFRDRLLKFLEEQYPTSEPPTPEIRSFIEALQNWAPDKDSPIRYIMSTLGDRGVRRFDNNFTQLCKKVGLTYSDNLNDPVRDGRLASNKALREQGSNDEIGTDIGNDYRPCPQDSHFQYGDTTASGGSFVP